jgi:hypothetical protein
MVKRCLSYNVIQLVDAVCSDYKKYKSCDDLCGLVNKPSIDMIKPPAKECVSYSVFLKKNPGASKKQRVEAIQRFYDNLY